MSKNVKHKNNKNILKCFILFLMLLIALLLIIIYINTQEKLKENKNVINIINEMYDNYAPYVTTISNSFLYNSNLDVVGEISKGMNIELENIDDKYEQGYYKLKNNDMYISYKDIKTAEEVKEIEQRYNNYIPFNLSVITDKSTKLYYDDNVYYIIYDKVNLPIVIMEEDKYYVIFDNKLLYVYKTDVSTIENINSTEEIAKELAVLNYHFVINEEAGEKELCSPSSICHTDTQFDEHMKYISDNNFYTITMKELELFIDGKINLPKKSISITIDDGWFVSRAIPILEKYNVMGTLFLIGSLAPVSDYTSNNLEIHSHTWNLHNVSNCKEGRSALLCYDKEKIIEDLMKSRESLNNTTYFCYPFYEYNNNAINSLKEAGFTMALTGGNKKAKTGIDKFKVPRYVIYNTTTVNQLKNYIL